MNKLMKGRKEEGKEGMKGGKNKEERNVQERE